MGISESAPVPSDSEHNDQSPAGVDDQEAAGRLKVIETKLRTRIERWANEIGYWGEASGVVVGESVPTDYSPPLTTATFRLGSLSFHCVQNDETGDFLVKLNGSKIPNIADLATLHRAMKESQASGEREAPTPG